MGGGVWKRFHGVDMSQLRGRLTDHLWREEHRQPTGACVSWIQCHRGRQTDKFLLTLTVVVKELLETGLVRMFPFPLF